MDLTVRKKRLTSILRDLSRSQHDAYFDGRGPRVTVPNPEPPANVVITKTRRGPRKARQSRLVKIADSLGR